VDTEEGKMVVDLAEVMQDLVHSVLVVEHSVRVEEVMEVVKKGKRVDSMVKEAENSAMVEAFLEKEESAVDLVRVVEQEVGGSVVVKDNIPT